MKQSVFLDPNVIIERLPSVLAALVEREAMANKHKLVGLAESISKIPLELASELSFKGIFTFGIAGRPAQQIAHAIRDPAIIALVARLRRARVDLALAEEISLLTAWPMQAVGKGRTAPFVFTDETGVEKLTLRRETISHQDAHKIAAERFDVSPSRIRQIIDKTRIRRRPE